MKFAIEKFGNECAVSVNVGGGAYAAVFFGSNDECWEYIGKYVNENKIFNFSVIDVFGRQHDYSRIEEI